MKNYLKALFIIAIITSIKTDLLSQVSDSSNLEINVYSDSNIVDSNYLFIDSTIMQLLIEGVLIQESYKEKSHRFLYIPTCSCLVKKREKWYLNKTDEPFSERCVVMSNSSTKDTICFMIPNSTIWADSTLIRYKSGLEVDKSYPGEIRIISNYFEGKRDGMRSYFTTNGNLSKIEFYNQGKLEWTKHFSNEIITDTKNN